MCLRNSGSLNFNSFARFSCFWAWFTPSRETQSHSFLSFGSESRHQSFMASSWRATARSFR